MATQSSGSRFHNLLIVLLLASACSVVAAMACSDDEEDFKALCYQSCEKFVECHPELPNFATSCKNICDSDNPSGSNQRCTNEAQLRAKYNECLAASCPQYDACLESFPECQTAGGGGGTGGMGGSPGTGGLTGQGGTGGLTGQGGTPGMGGSPATGGMSGSADCGICTKADACCVALAGLSGGDAQACTLAQTCASAGANQTTIIQSCQAILTSGAQALPDLAACQ